LAEEDFEKTHFIQELYATTATHATTVMGMPVVSNARGVFMYTGDNVVELTRPVRHSLGSFGASAITVDYTRQKIVGASFVIDVQSKKLFDYQSGFRYTTPLLVQRKGFGPFTINSLAIAYEMADAESATISWQTKAEDNDWFTEEDFEISATGTERSRIERQILNPERTAHKFQIRLTALSSNVYIRAMYANVVNLAVEGSSE
jgi:hypothetical protein